VPHHGKAPAPFEPDRPEVSNDRVFGQVNRLFPLKLACRWIAARTFSKQSDDTQDWPSYPLISDTLADDAATLGSLLEKSDIAAGRKRDEQLATGLPRRGNSASRDRFLGQFIARITRAGEIYSGALCHYVLARFKHDVIALTEQGVLFAEIKNPILDSADLTSKTALSAEETDFLTRQILKLVPPERDDMRIVLSAIAEGKVRPNDLIEAIRPLFPSNWTDSMVLTHISGLVARLSDLELIARRWQGRQVEYELAKKGHEFLGSS